MRRHCFHVHTVAERLLFQYDLINIRNSIKSEGASELSQSQQKYFGDATNFDRNAHATHSLGMMEFI